MEGTCKGVKAMRREGTVSTPKRLERWAFPFALFFLAAGGLVVCVLEAGVYPLPSAREAQTSAYAQAYSSPEADMTPTAYATAQSGTRPVCSSSNWERVPPGFPPGVNITRQQYDEASAKWKAQGAENYQIVVNDLFFGSWSGKWKLLVHVTGGKSKVLQYQYLSEENEPQPLPDVPAKYEKDFRNYISSLTVENMLGYIDDNLKEAEISSPDGSACSHFAYVEFNESYGYPTVYKSGLVAAFDGQDFMEIESVTILRSALPGMPGTGNPGP